jgi:hypothetical protein
VTYYKATQPSREAFYGGVTYEVGKTVEHPTSKRYSDMEGNNPSTYLSVSVEPGEALVGGRWPCRLFEVKPVGRTVRRSDGALPHKRGCRALTVVRELPAHMALGPNGEAVAALIERCKMLTYAEATELDAARSAAGAARDAAWGAARDAARGAALALLVQDLITPAEFKKLYDPWRKVIG